MTPQPTHGHPSLALADVPAWGQPFIVAGAGYAPNTDYGVLVHWPGGTVGGSDAWADAQGHLAFTAYAYFHGQYTVEIQERKHSSVIAEVTFTVA